MRINNLVALIDPEDGGIQQGGFVCYNDSTGDTPVTVQAGDVIGACIFDPDDSLVLDFNKLQLDIIGEQSGLGESLLGLTVSCSLFYGFNPRRHLNKCSLGS